MPRLVALFATLLGLSLGAAGLAHAQSMPGSAPPSAQQGGMCSGMCDMGSAPAQGTPMPGMMQGGCPMMRRSSAQLEARLRRLEEHSGVPAPPPGQPGTPPG